jgi:hypothetical protein
MTSDTKFKAGILKRRKRLTVASFSQGNGFMEKGSGKAPELQRHLQGKL